jgi:hypothetical protein
MTCRRATEPTSECYVGALHYSSVEVEPPLSEEETVGVWIVYGLMTDTDYDFDGVADYGNVTKPDHVYDFSVRDGRSVASSPQLDLYYRCLPR